MDNILKYSHVFPAVFVFCKMNMLLLPSLSNMIIDSASCWVGGRWLVSREVSGRWSGGRLNGGSVVYGFNKTQEKKCLG